MNIIKTNNYEGDYICPICREIFKENDEIYLVKHHDDNNSRPEKIDQSRKRKHIFHGPCMLEYIEQKEKSHQNHDQECDHECPLDRQKINKLITVKYYEIAALNIINFSDNYYELLDKFSKKDVVYVSIIDRINLNYKDINGKTVLYCAAQRGDLKLVKQLIKLGAHPTIADDNGFTPLMASVTHNFISIVKYLLKLPSVINEINYIDDKDKTAIEYAYDYRRFQCVLELLKVKGLNHRILLNLLNQYQKIKPNDPTYAGCQTIINEIKIKIKKYLKIPNITKLEIKKLNMPDGLQNKVPTMYYKINDPRENEHKVLNVDIDKNPELLDLIYNPIDNKTVPLSYKMNELNSLLRYEQFDPDLIYQPCESNSKIITRVCEI